MAMIKVKLSEKSQRQFLLSQSGYVINKEEFTEVDDEDRDIHSFLINRTDIIIGDEEYEKPKEKVAEQKIIKPKKEEKKVEKPKKEKKKEIFAEPAPKKTIVDKPKTYNEVKTDDE